jgi:hypothetical protein
MVEQSDIEAHYDAFFYGHTMIEHQWSIGPTIEIMPDFRVREYPPGPRSQLVTYVSVGASSIRNSAADRLEFAILSRDSDLRCVELITILSWFHSTTPLGAGHTFNIGEPWKPGSSCDHLLISIPYPLGPDFRVCNLHDDLVHFYWLLPITKSEHDYKISNGLDALESLFDEAEFDFSDPFREPVV